MKSKSPRVYWFMVADVIKASNEQPEEEMLVGGLEAS